MKESRLLVPIVWFALICWAGLIYYQPYALFLPFLVGGIFEAMRPHSPPKKEPPTGPVQMQYSCPHGRRHTIDAPSIELLPSAMARYECGCPVDKP
jgi:hypothetical protein